MVKKIKVKKVKTAEEIEQERLEKEREAAGIQDDFQAKGVEAASWAQKNQGVVYSLIALVVVMAIGAGLFSTRGKAAKDASSAMFADATAVMNEVTPDADGEALVAAATKLASIGGDGEGHPTITLYRAGLLARAGQLSEAEALYNNFLSSTKTSNPIYFLGLDGLTNVYEKQGKQADALSTLNKWVSIEHGVDKGSALLKIAEIELVQGNADKAKDPALRVIREFEDRDLVQSAEKVLKQLGVDTTKVERAGQKA